MAASNPLQPNLKCRLQPFNFCRLLFLQRNQGRHRFHISINIFTFEDGAAGLPFCKHAKEKTSAAGTIAVVDKMGLQSQNPPPELQSKGEGAEVNSCLIKPEEKRCRVTCVNKASPVSIMAAYN